MNMAQVITGREVAVYSCELGEGNFGISVLFTMNSFLSVLRQNYKTVLGCLGGSVG